MTILLIGAKSQVGSEFAKLALDQNYPCISLDRAQLDLTDLNKTYETIIKIKPIIVINCAAYTAVDKAESEPTLAFKINRDAPAVMAKACVQLQIPLLHLSTDYVFAGDATVPYSEEVKTGPLGIYGESKLAGEEQIRHYHSQHIIVRTSWVFRAQGHNFVKTILRFAKEREQLSIVADQVGGPTAAADLARMLLQIVQALQVGNTAWGTYHFCGQPAVSWYEFAEHIIEYARLQMPLKIKSILPITTNEYPTPAQRPRYSVLNTDKIEKIFKISAPDWRKALTQVIKELAHETLPT